MLVFVVLVMPQRELVAKSFQYVWRSMTIVTSLVDSKPRVNNNCAHSHLAGWCCEAMSLSPPVSTGVPRQESLWWQSPTPCRTHPWPHLKNREWEHKSSRCSLGLRGLRGEEKEYRLCFWMPVPLVPFPAKRMCSPVLWAYHSKIVWSPVVQQCWWWLFSWSHQPHVDHQRGQNALSWHSNLVVFSFLLCMVWGLQSPYQSFP